MGIKLLKATLAILGIAFCLTPVAVAWDNQDGDDHQRFIVLTATADAPAGAKGFAAVGLGICGGTNAPTLRVGTEGLLLGTYSVSVTDNTGTNTFELGTFDVRTLMLESPMMDWTNWTGGVNVGGAQLPLPAGFDATNGFSVSIADSNTVVDLTGAFSSFTNAPHRDFRVATLLTATTNAPAGAVGRAILEAEDHEDDEDDAGEAELNIRTIGLSVGTYTATITDVGSNAFVLGTLDVNVRTHDDVDEQGDDDSQGNDNSQGDMSSWWTTNPVGYAEFPLPGGLDASNVVTISISDSNGVVDLVGDFTNPTFPGRCDFDEHVRLLPGPTCTNLQGIAELRLQLAKGKARGKFSLIAQGVPARQKLSLFVNGVSAGTVKSNRQGKLAIKHLPKSVNLMTVTTVEVRDKAGNIVCSASF